MDPGITNMLHCNHYLVKANLAEERSFAENVGFFKAKKRLTSLSPAL